MDLLKSVKSRQTEKKDFTSAVIVAAGKSERMKMGCSKQLLPIGGVPVIAWTISAFEVSRSIDEIIIVTREEDIFPIAEVVRKFELYKVKKIVAGGATRQESAAAGLEVVDPDSCLIAVHDGARPLVTPECIDKVVEAAQRKQAAALAVRLKDTVKEADDDGVVRGTPDRSRLWAVQTPQVFTAFLYREAIKRALNDHEIYTDDCQLFESMGRTVQLVEGEYTNIKITTPDDLVIAEAIIRSRGVEI